LGIKQDVHVIRHDHVSVKKILPQLLALEDSILDARCNAVFAEPDGAAARAVKLRV
jgi:hypothetical protein